MSPTALPTFAPTELCCFVWWCHGCVVLCCVVLRCVVVPWMMTVNQRFKVCRETSLLIMNAWYVVLCSTGSLTFSSWHLDKRGLSKIWYGKYATELRAMRWRVDQGMRMDPCVLCITVLIGHSTQWSKVTVSMCICVCVCAILFSVGIQSEKGHFPTFHCYI